MWEDKSHSLSMGHTMPFAGVTTTLPDSKTLIQNQRHNLVNATSKHIVSSLSPYKMFFQIVPVFKIFYYKKEALTFWI